jgi:spermidine/putrescine transport system substrate-binding protein
MKKYVLAVAIIALCCFVGGILWGTWSLQLRRQKLAQSAPLRVLCGESWLPLSALEKFSQENNVRIEQYTFRHSGDFLRQMANADGKIDVICTSSLLVRSLVRSHWLKKTNFSTLPNMKLISIDFAHLPYDPNSEYTVPLFWNLYGFVGKSEPPKLTWRQIWQTKHIALWGDELNVLHQMSRLDLNAEERIEEDQKTEALGLAFKKFTRGGIRFLKPDIAVPPTSDAVLGRAEWVQLPLSYIAPVLSSPDSPYHFWLPEDGATVEVGVLTIGERSTQPDLAQQLINELIDTPQAQQTHAQLGAGVVHSSLNGLASLNALQKPEALRKFPLNRLSFPDVDVQDLPRFQKIFEDSTGME